MKDTEQFLREFNEAWIREDTETILNGVTDDICFRMVNEAGIKGREAFARMLDEMTGSGNDCSLDIDRVIVDGDTAALNGDIRVTGKDGKPKTYGFCDIYGLRQGRISSIDVYFVERQ